MTWILAWSLEKDWFCFLLCGGGRQYVAAVDLLMKNEVAFWKIWLALLCVRVFRFWKLETRVFQWITRISGEPEEPGPLLIMGVQGQVSVLWKMKKFKQCFERRSWMCLLTTWTWFLRGLTKSGTVTRLLPPRFAFLDFLGLDLVGGSFLRKRDLWI